MISSIRRFIASESAGGLVLALAFFFVVGLETKREVLAGELASLQQASLPAAAALGGMVVPALICVAFNHAGRRPVARRGPGRYSALNFTRTRA